MTPNADRTARRDGVRQRAQTADLINTAEAVQRRGQRLAQVHLHAMRLTGALTKLLETGAASAADRALIAALKRWATGAPA